MNDDANDVNDDVNDPLSSNDQQEVRDTHQYAGQALIPLGYRTSRQPAGIGMLAHFSQPPLVDPMLWLRMELPESQWQLHLLHDIVHSQTASHWAAVAAGGNLNFATFLVPPPSPPSLTISSSQMVSP